MKFVVRASYQDNQPTLQVLDLDSGRICLRWRPEAIQGMFDTGVIDKQEFLQPDKYGMQLLLDNLFLISCRHNPDPPQQDPCMATAGCSEWSFACHTGPRR